MRAGQAVRAEHHVHLRRAPPPATGRGLPPPRAPAPPQGAGSRGSSSRRRTRWTRGTAPARPDLLEVALGVHGAVVRGKHDADGAADPVLRHGAHHLLDPRGPVPHAEVAAVHDAGPARGKRVELARAARAAASFPRSGR